jgi:hypothetical protein
MVDHAVIDSSFSSQPGGPQLLAWSRMPSLIDLCRSIDNAFSECVRTVLHAIRFVKRNSGRHQRQVEKLFS